MSVATKNGPDPLAFHSILPYYSVGGVWKKGGVSLKGGDPMALYVMLTNLTDEGRKTLMEKPDRLKEVNKEVESMGVKVLAQYALLGGYDFLNILEAQDNQTIAKVAVALGARGTISTTTLAALAVDDFIKMLKK
jgi:uncharacterized protein with GYD domain